MIERIRRRLAITALAVIFVLCAGTSGFVILEGWPPFDAFYMSLMTITTVGYKEVHDLTHAGRVFNSFLILFGVSTMLLAVGSMTQTIIELELSGFFRKRQTRRMIDKLDEHFIVCGFGRVGRGAAHELHRAQAPFVVVDRDTNKVERAVRSGYLAIESDSTHDQTLRDLGVQRAKGLIAALSTDADNLFVILSAKGLNPNLQVSTRVLEEESEQKLKRAGADAVLAPYTITGARLAQAILRPHVTQFLDFTTMNVGLNVRIEQVQVGTQSEYVSKSLRQIQLRREVGVIVLAIRKASGAMLFNPDPEAELQAGDYLIAMGEPKQLSKLESMLAEARA